MKKDLIFITHKPSWFRVSNLLCWCIVYLCHNHLLSDLRIKAIISHTNRHASNKMLYFWQKQLTYNKIQLTIWQRGTENNFSIPLFFTLKNCQIKNCLSNISYLSSPKMRTNCGHAAQNKNPKQLVCKCLGFFTGTRSRGRTGTTLLSLVFETNASTDSAIRANLFRRIGMAKIVDSS